jgi:hypothetical protein
VRITNRQFANEDVSFKVACANAGLPRHITVVRSRKGNKVKQGKDQSLTRQASKWRRGLGLAWKEMTK